MLSWTLPSCPQDVFVVDMQTGSTTSLTAGECTVPGLGLVVPAALTLPVFCRCTPRELVCPHH